MHFVGSNPTSPVLFLYPKLKKLRKGDVICVYFDGRKELCDGESNEDR